MTAIRGNVADPLTRALCEHALDRRRDGDALPHFTVNFGFLKTLAPLLTQG